jgi:hypothetical protein
MVKVKTILVDIILLLLLCRVIRAQDDSDKSDLVLGVWVLAESFFPLPCHGTVRWNGREREDTRGRRAISEDTIIMRCPMRGRSSAG